MQRVRLIFTSDFEGTVFFLPSLALEKFNWIVDIYNFEDRYRPLEFDKETFRIYLIICVVYYKNFQIIKRKSEMVPSMFSVYKFEQKIE